MKEKTKDIELYEAGKSFNNKLDPPYYDTVSTNSEMFNGNQWIHSKTSDELPRPVFNIINRIVNFFVASLTSNATKISYSIMSDFTPEQEVAVDLLNKAMENFYEREKMQDKVRQMYLDAAISGDMALHIYFDADKKPYDGKLSKVEGEICCEVIDGVNLYLGNPNSRDIQSQPHVIISGRATIQELQEEYDKHRSDDYKIQTDSDYEEHIGENKIELDDVDSLGKATYIITYKKKKVKTKKMNELTGEEETTEETRVFVSKSISDRYIYENVDTGLTHYPVAFGNWETQKNNYHGRSLVTSIVPNQIFINRMFAMAMYHLMMAAFPKAIYDAERINSWSNKIGASIGVKNMAPGDNIANVAKYIEPGQMSAQIVQFINLAIETTKDMLGANNALLGSVNPEMASGTSITVAARQSGVPLENPKNNMYSLLEDVGRIFIDVVTANYGERPIITEQDEQAITVQYDFGQIKNIYVSPKVDVGATTYWNEIAMIQTLDNLLANQHITFEQYLERVPNDYIQDKQGLLNGIREAITEQMQAGMEIPPEIAAQMQGIPPEQQQALVQEFLATQ